MRLEFWGDEVDTIAAFDLLTQRRGDGVEAVEITPAREVLVADPAALAAKLRKLGKNGPEALLADAERLETGAEVAGLDRYLSLCLPERATLFDYLEDAFVFTSELQEMTQELEGFHWQLGEDVKELLEQKLLSGKATAFADEKGAFLARLGRGRTAFLETFSRQLEFPLKELLDFTAVSTASWSGQMNLLLEELASQQEQNYCTLILAGTEKAAKTLAYDLQRDGYNAQYND